MKPETEAIHRSLASFPPFRPVNFPIYYTSNFSFKDMDHMRKVFSKGSRFPKDMREEYVYTRGGNPTQRALEETVAALEGGEEALSFSSGMAAIYTTIKALFKGKVAYLSPCYGESHLLLEKVGKPFGKGEEEKVVAYEPDVIYMEAPSNPLLFSWDMDILRESGALIVVDNTVASPVFQNPLKMGADVVIHSATKYLSGHGDALGGIVVSNSEYISKIRDQLFQMGNQLDPFAAWLILRGIKTLFVRMERHWKSAEKVVKFLMEHPKVKRVFYPGLDDVSKKQMRGYSGLISFEPASRRIEPFIQHLQLFTFAVSLGAVESLVEVPSAMTHRGVIGDGHLIRLSIGLEHPDDLIADLEQALGQLSIESTHI